MDRLMVLQKKLNSVSGQIYSSSLFTGVFGLLGVMMGSRFWFIPMVFFGVIPLVQALTKKKELQQQILTLSSGTLADHANPRKNRISQKDKELLVFRIAREKGGIVTPVSLTLDGGLTLDESEEILQDLMNRGYASLEVGEDGKLQYVFSEFLGKI